MALKWSFSEMFSGFMANYTHLSEFVLIESSKGDASTTHVRLLANSRHVTEYGLIIYYQDYRSDRCGGSR